MRIRRLLFLMVIHIMFVGAANGQSDVRHEIRVPDVLGYQTLKCDLHMHTVFSDGSVWPDVRVREAWREGLDAISVTDHIEYLPHKEDVVPSHNRPYEIAKRYADMSGIILIRGSEITREEPPGHWNAIFLKDCAALDCKDYMDALEAAVKQDAFIFWNHPGWKQPGGKAVWYAEQQAVFEKGWLHGIEVVNGGGVYPEALAWCNEKDLTIMGNSDIHAPSVPEPGKRRSMTLVFAESCSEEAIHEALKARRSVAVMADNLFGNAIYLRALFDGAVTPGTTSIQLKDKAPVFVWLTNKSDLRFELVSAGETAGLKVPDKLTLHPGKTVLMQIRKGDLEASEKKQIRVSYLVTNLNLAPGKVLQVDWIFECSF